jgi:hypothetical protein
MQVGESRTGLFSVLRQDRPEILSVFEGLRGRARAAALQAAVIEAKVAVGHLRDGIAATERELALEQKHWGDAERRGELARQIPDPETVAIAERFAAKHRERATVLERKLSVQKDELVLAERELAEMTEALKSPTGEPDADDPALKIRMDRAGYEAAAEAQLAHLKRKLGKDKP